MLEIKNLTKSFGRKNAVSDVSLCLDNKIYGLLGPNGAGKTTLIRCITGLYPFKKGEILYNSKSIKENDGFYRNFGYLPQKFGVFKELTCSEALKLLFELKKLDGNPAEEASRALEAVGLVEKSEAKVKTLSGGMLQRLGVAQSILGDPDVIVFDEPTAGLDPEERLRFKNIIAQIKKDKTIIISTHIVEDLEALSDELIVMDKGKIAFTGTCASLQQKAEGKVFDIREEDRDKIQQPFHIQKHFERDTQKYIGFLSSAKQDSAVPVKPTTEDGYICVLKKI